MLELKAEIEAAQSVRCLLHGERFGLGLDQLVDHDAVYVFAVDVFLDSKAGSRDVVTDILFRIAADQVL